MSFEQYEESVDSGAPLELYEFSLGLTKFRYTNAEKDFTFQTQVYTATPIERSRIISTIDSKDGQVNIELPGNNVFARLYIGIIPGEFPEITIRQLHVPDPSAEAIFVFQGSVSTVGFVDDLRKANLACRPITSASSKVIPRDTFQGQCNNNLYDDRCTISEPAFDENVTVATVVDRVVTIDSGQLSTEVAGYWLGGFIEHLNEFRSIVVQSGRIMTVDLPFLDSPAAATVRILPGCNHIIDEDCDLVYSNTVNHTGFPYVPTKNPFEGLD
jgi:uncharacterized phage protein (TIGR02218 family)